MPHSSCFTDRLPSNIPLVLIPQQSASSSNLLSGVSGGHCVIGSGASMLISGSRIFRRRAVEPAEASESPLELALRCEARWTESILTPSWFWRILSLLLFGETACTASSFSFFFAALLFITLCWICSRTWMVPVSYSGWDPESESSTIWDGGGNCYA